MTTPQIITHKSGMQSFRLDTLNDKQRESLFEQIAEEAILFISIGDVCPSTIITVKGARYILKMTLRTVKLVEKR